ncbi:MAG: cysteine--tRNA ligase [Patescibacteria group bacterium]
MQIYNSLSGKKEKLSPPLRDKELKLFVCGPTVYDDPHMGHARTAVSFDIIAKFLRTEGFSLNYLQNITNIDDKIINRAKEQNENPFALAERFEGAYMDTMKMLGVDSITTYARASDHIPEVIKQVQTLIQKEYAYRIEGDGYYFDIKKFEDYGKLSKRTALQAEDSVSRIDEGIEKRNRGDFCLWKFVDVRDIKNTSEHTIIHGEPAWNSPFGWGRPGWHIEDTAITEKYFGPQYDLHGGGLDLKFPHHEAEIAQQEAASGKKPFVRFWLHAGFVSIDGEKMSKSKKNFISVTDFFKKNGSDNEATKNTFRILVASHHYRSPMNFSWELFEQARVRFSSLVEFVTKLEFIKNSKNTKEQEHTSIDAEKIEQSFFDAMRDDFNTPLALGMLFSEMNRIAPYMFSLNKNDINSFISATEKCLHIIGISIPHHTVPERVIHIMNERELSRAHKQFAHADALRKEIEELGYEVEDTPIGPFVKKIK